MELAEVVRSGLLGGSAGTCSDTGGVMSLQGVDRPQRVTEIDEETQREECSSTESTHQEVRNTLWTCKFGEDDYNVCVGLFDCKLEVFFVNVTSV